MGTKSNKLIRKEFLSTYHVFIHIFLKYSNELIISYRTKRTTLSPINSISASSINNTANVITEQHSIKLKRKYNTNYNDFLLCCWKIHKFSNELAAFLFFSFFSSRKQKLCTIKIIKTPHIHSSCSCTIFLFYFFLCIIFINNDELFFCVVLRSSFLSKVTQREFYVTSFFFISLQNIYKMFCCEKKEKFW